MTIDEKINEWTEKRDQLEIERSKIEVKPIKEMVKHSLLPAIMFGLGFPAMDYWLHGQVFEATLYMGSALAVMFPGMGLVMGCLNMFGGDYAAKDHGRMKELQSEINHHNEVLQSIRNHPERYDSEAWYRIQVARLDK